MSSLFLLIFVFVTWCLWVIACAAQQAVEDTRRGIPIRGVSVLPVVPIAPLSLWLLSFLFKPWGFRIIAAIHLLFLILLVISIIRDVARLRTVKGSRQTQD